MYYEEESQSLSLDFNLAEESIGDALLSFRVKMQNYENKLETSLSEIDKNFGFEDFMTLNKLLDPANKYIDSEKKLALEVEVN